MNKNIKKIFKKVLEKPLRNEVKKELTNRLGNIVETEDEIICSINKNMGKKDTYKQIFSCIGIMERNKETLKTCNLDKKIIYIFDGIDFNSKKSVEIFSYGDCNIIIKNCKFNKGLTLMACGDCTLDNSYINDYSLLSISAKDLTIKNMDIDNPLKLIKEKYLIELDGNDSLVINNCNIGKLKENTSVKIRSCNNIDISNSNISGKDVEINAKNKSVFNNTIIRAEENVSINDLSHTAIRIDSPSIIINGKEIDSSNIKINNTSDTLKKEEKQILKSLKDNKRKQLIELLKHYREIKEEKEINNDQKIKTLVKER